MERLSSSPQHGFTLAELMVVVAILSVLAVAARAKFSRDITATDLDGFTRAIRDACTTASRRAVTKGRTYKVHLTQSSVQWCLDNTTNCPASGIGESGRAYQAGADATIKEYYAGVDLADNATYTTIGSGLQYYFFATGSSSSSSSGAYSPVGLTLRLQRSTNTNKRTRVVVYPWSGRPRIIDNW